MVDYFIMIDQKLNVLKIPARDRETISELMEWSKEYDEDRFTEHKTRKAFFDTIKAYLNDTRNERS